MLGRLALQWLTQGVAVAVNRQLRPPLRDQVVHRARPSHARAVQQLHKRMGARLWGSNLLADVEGVVAAVEPLDGAGVVASGRHHDRRAEAALRACADQWLSAPPGRGGR